MEGLTEIWRDLDVWVRQRITAGGLGLSGFLQEHARLAPSGASQFPPGGEQAGSRLSLCLSGHIRGRRFRRVADPISAVEQGPATIRRPRTERP